MARKHCSTFSSGNPSLRNTPYVTARPVAAFSSVSSSDLRAVQSGLESIRGSTLRQIEQTFLCFFRKELKDSIHQGRINLQWEERFRVPFFNFDGLAMPSTKDSMTVDGPPAHLDSPRYFSLYLVLILIHHVLQGLYLDLISIEFALRNGNIC